MRPTPTGPAHRGQGGYLLVLFVIIMAFVGVAAAMQVLILTSVATTSRAYDSYRQSNTEMGRLERAVAEALLDQRQVCLSTDTRPLAEVLASRLSDISAGGATLTTTALPSATPAIVTFPSSSLPVDPLGPVPADFTNFLTPELALLAGPNAAVYPELQFQFASTRDVLGTERTYGTQVTARLIAVPLTRFPIAAYDLPAEIGAAAGAGAIGPASNMPQGIVPARDAAFVDTLQAHPGVLPYAYRRRAVLAAAYQYVFSQPFIARVTEYAGITHFHDLDAAPGTTAMLAGMSTSGSITSWDLGVAGSGTYGTVSMTRDAAVIFTESPGRTLRLDDSMGDPSLLPLLIMLLGPTDPKAGPLTLDVSNVARPVVIIACNVRVTGNGGATINGALFLDPQCGVATTGALAVGHLSYWGGSTSVPGGSVTIRPLPAATEAIAPRVVYVATRASRL